MSTSKLTKPKSGKVVQDTINSIIDDLSGKQATLVSGTTIRTINGTSLLGSGNITISSSEGDNVFVATYNLTSYNDIRTAINDGKFVYVAFNDSLSSGEGKFAPLCYYNFSSNDFKFMCIDETVNYTACYIIKLNGTNHVDTWSYTAFPFEDSNNRENSISSTSTNSEYPSAKCVYDNLLLKENISNKKTSISSASTDDEYPTAKCVYGLTLNARFDGQPTASHVQIFNGTAITSSYYSLSSYLPNDGKDYEVLVEINIGSGNNTYLCAGNIADPYTNREAGTGFILCTYTTSNGTQAHNTCWIPLPNMLRKLYYQLGHSKASSSASIHLLGYRRLGSNS